ncbi:MAG: hypothetical protein H0W07_00685 [Chloroflexi bacterium]|nr:hypothetical protein [Chloroflexota bacterium]
MKRNIVEWLVLGASVLAILAVVGVLVLEGLGAGGPPDPRIELHRDQARTSTLGWIVPATVSNEGDTAAARIGLEAMATVDGQEEVSTVDVDFLAPGSEVEVEIGFSAEPEGEIEVRLLGYGLP